jgi:hypothetical protein
MAYTCKFGAGSQIYLDNQEEQTVIRVQSSGPGQQQGQSQGFGTGKWTQPPLLFETGNGLVAQVVATRGRFFFALNGGSISRLETEPALHDAKPLSLQKADEDSQRPEPMKPMAPMEPMKPMEMRMGNMQMSMGATQQPTTSKRFCTQCGREANATDRFCAGCGHQLSS